MAAQSHWTLAAGVDNMILYGEQSSYLGGIRIGFDYRYDFRNAHGLGIETGLYLRDLGRRYNRNIAGVYNLWDIGDVNEDMIVSRKFLYSSINLLGYHVPLHLTYTHLFYRDWSITAFAGVSLDDFLYEGVAAFHQVLLFTGTSYKSGTIHPLGLRFNPAVDFGLNFSFKHLQMKLGAYLYGKSCSGEFRFDGSIPTEEEAINNPSRWAFPAGLYLTAGYRF